MALIIKGDMPTCCDRCFYSSRCFVYSQTVQKLLVSNHEQLFDVFGEVRLKDCPILGEIPDEHGRLVDADKFRKEVEAWRGCHTAIFTFVDFLALLDNTPTVVEASK